MELLTIINPENITQNELDGYSLRKAARAIVFDSNNNNIAIMNVSRNNYHKLPGGGVEVDESIEVALARECKEELGCTVEIISELGKIIEYRKEKKMIGESYCFVAKVVGEKGVPDFTEKELSRGFLVEWMSLDDAVVTLKNDISNDDSSKYILPRDIAFLETAQKSLQ